MKLDLKRLVSVMTSVWMSAILLLLFLVPIYKTNGGIVTGFNGITKLFDVNESLIKYIGIMNIVILISLVINLLYSVFFAFVTVGKIKGPLGLHLYKCEIFSITLSFVIFISSLLELVLSIIAVNKYSFFKYSCGLFIQLAIMILFIIILFYVLFKFDQVAPQIQGYESDILKKRIEKNKKNKKVENETQQEMHKNRAQRRAEKKK